MAANPSRPSGSSSVRGPALVPMGHHAGKPAVPLTRPVTVIGSRSTARIHLISSTVSKAHALLVKSSGGMYIRDLASRSHVYINGEQVREADLNDGDLIKIGSFTFKFVAGPIRQPEARPLPPAELEVTGGDFPIPVDQRVLLIGRRSSDDIVLLEDSASTAHAVLFEMDGDRYVRDLGSRTGTFVNGVSTHQHKLSPGDVIRVGETDIRYHLAAATAGIDVPGESATGYALEAPQDEIQAGPEGEHGEHDTIGGLDLVGEIVRGEVDEDRDTGRERDREERLQWRRPAQEAIEPIASPDEIAQEDEAAPAVDEVHAAQELEPLEPVEEEPAADAAGAAAPPRLAPIPLSGDDGGQEAAAPPAAAQPVPSADIEDLADELLGEEASAQESLSVESEAPETSSRVSAGAAAEAAPEPAPVPLEAQGFAPSPPREQEQPQESLEPAHEVEDELAAPAEEQRVSTTSEGVVERDADLLVHDGQDSAPEAAPEPAVDDLPEPALAAEGQRESAPSQRVEAAQQDQPSEVLQFSEPTSSVDDQRSYDDASAGGTAVLDQEALASPAPDEPVEEFTFAEAPGTVGQDQAQEPLQGLALHAQDLKLEFSEPEPPAAQQAPPLEPIDISGIDLALKEEQPAPADLGMPAPAEEPAPALDFSIKEAPPEAPAPLLDLEKAPPAPLFRLSEDAEALASATEALTRRRRAQQEREEADRERTEALDLRFDEPAQQPIEPFAFEEPQVEIPGIEQIEAPVKPIEPLPEPAAEQDFSQDQPPRAEPGRPFQPTVEVLDQTQPTPESALGLDQATEDVPLDDSAISRAIAGDEPAADADTLTDTHFERAVEDFAAQTSGDIVEANEPAAAPDAHSEPAAAEADELVVPREHDRPAKAQIDPFLVGANQENFLGGVPLPRVEVPGLKTKPLPIQTDPVDELIAEIDGAAAAAERAQVTAPFDEPGGDQRGADNRADAVSGDVTRAPFVPVAPAVPRPPRKPRPIARRGVELGKLPAHVDESIPPYSGRDATAGEVTTAFDGLAMPPVRQADVFSQMSPPALDRPGAARGAGASDDSPEASGVMTPMDLIGIRREPPPQGGRRRPRGVPGAFKVPGEAFFAGGNVGKTAPDAPPVEGAGLPGTAPLDPLGAAATVPRSDRPADAAGIALAIPEQVASASPSTAAVAAPPPPGAAGRRRVRPAMPDAQVDAVDGFDAPVIYADPLDYDPAAQKRRYLRRMTVCIVLAIVLAPLAAVATYLLVPVRSQVEASITYRNLAERTKRDRDEIQLDQLRRLQSDYLRRAAMKNVLQSPEVSPGFLDDTVKYSRVVERAEWRESSNVWSLTLPYEGTQREHDRIRMKALATALWQDNKDTLIKAEKDARSQVERLEQTIRANQKREQELRGEIAAQRILYEKRPSPEQVKLLEGELARHEEAWKRAVSAVKEAEAELNRLKQGAATAAASGAAELKDEELAKMQRELEGLQARADANRHASSEQARQAREQLDSAMEAFKQEISNANAAVPGSPEMAAYIESAQKLQETTRDVIEDMTRRQEQQFNSLMDLKQRLNEKMEARRSEMWQADRELQDLTERLAILTRQYNAAVGGGLKKEAEEKKAEVELTQSMIRARQELIPVDPGYAEAIQQIEQFITTTRKNIEEDRKRTDDLLARLQKSFTSGPQLASLPADQQELARRLEAKLSSINAARQQYNQSLDAGAERVGDATLQQQIATLQAGIDARRKQLVEQQSSVAARAPADAVKQKQAELDSVRLEQKKAEEAYFAARQELDNARRAVADARASFEKLEKLEAERNTLLTTLKTQNDTLVDKQRELKESVYPEQPIDSNIRVSDGIDRRLTYAGIAGGSIFLLLFGLGSIAFMQAGRVGPIAPLAAADLRPIQHPHPQPAANGNGQPNPASPGDDDHQPAIV